MTPSSVAGLPKHETLAQKWRKSLSRVVAVIGLGVVLGGKPAGLGQGWHLLAEMLGILLLILAALGRIWALTYIAGRKNKELCQNGPYSVTRNPLYFFSFLGTIGFMLAVQSVLLAIIAAIFFLAYYNYVIRGEEIRLGKIHGDAYADYCRRVSRFWPRFSSHTSEESVELMVKPFTRGMRETFWFLATIALAEGIEWAQLHSLWPTFTLPF